MDMQPFYRRDFDRNVAHYKAFLRQQQERTQKQRMEKDADQIDEDLIDLGLPAVLAADAQIKAFSVKLEGYDTAVVHALNENTAQFERVQAKIQAMLTRAYKLEDGRRVFKTEDGLRVFDEHGTELLRDDIDPDEIPDHLERWESYKSFSDLEDGLKQERADILEYQDKLDEARDRIKDPELTKDELDSMEAELEAEMPDAVKRYLPGADQELHIAKDLPDLSTSKDFDANTLQPAPVPGG